MKNLVSISLIIMLSAGLIACKHDKDKNKQDSVSDAAKAVVQAPVAPAVTPKEVAPVAPAVTPKEVAPATQEFKEGEVKQVCVDINGKTKCKKMKVHKKFEGTKIPPKK